ncbi:putative CoA-binding protein [Halalkalibacter oceani]
MPKYKCVLSVRVANELIDRGYKLVTIEPSYRYEGKLVFVFRNTPELDAEFKRFERKG